MGLCPADLDGDGCEEVVAYSPWDDAVHLYGSTPAPSHTAKGFVATARHYNVRLMDGPALQEGMPF